LSRKGYVQVLRNELEQRLEVVALRKGNVLLSIPEKGRHILFNVVKKDDISKTSHASPNDSRRKGGKYWLSIRLVSIENRNSTKRLSLESLVGAKLSFNDLVQKAESSGFYARSMALPGLVIEGDRSYALGSGGETSTAVVSENAFVEWKSYGFSLELATLMLRSCETNLKYRLSITRPQQSARRIVGGNIKGDHDVSCDKEELVAMLDYDNQIYEQSGFDLWSGIPILGPIFKSKARSSGLVQLALYIKITAL
jgi:hypothetical protein